MEDWWLGMETEMGLRSEKRREAGIRVVVVE